ncbi:MAG: hypothetical protein IK144_12515 [Bacteroidaceae bacterium]|nr:hypothetical protein [Bacteroidaceae bacterium]
MSIIKCPECRSQVSTMAGTCPNCGTRISGQLRTCPNCGGYYLVTQEECPECKSPIPAPTSEECQSQTSDTPVVEENQKETPEPASSKMAIVGYLVKAVFSLFLFCLIGICVFQYQKQEKLKKELAEYKRLASITNPEFYQQFLNDYPESKHYDEIHDRMLKLQVEAKDWQQLQQGINRATVARFLQNHPGSLRQRICEDILDSIDWHDAQAIGSEEAITDYLSKHPSGLYVNEAAEKKNAMLLAKVTPAERTMIRGTLEAFFSKAIANQDIEAARQAIPDTMVNFCGKQNANAEAIVQYAREKMAKDVIGLHYIIGQQMGVRKETLPDGNTGFAVEVGLQETISRSDTNQPTSNQYRITALINQEQKIVRMNITK